MQRMMGIDPGPEKSAYVMVERAQGLSLNLKDMPGTKDSVQYCGYCDNDDVLRQIECLRTGAIAIEEVVGRPGGGRSLTDTAFEAGRFFQAAHYNPRIKRIRLITRSKIRWHVIKDKRGGDSEIIEHLIDRYCPDLHTEYRRSAALKSLGGKSYMTRPKMINESKKMFFKDFKKDIWQAMAVAVTCLDLNEKGEV